ncbi:MAG: hypothetical protein U9P14_00620 [Gemmatimonadota bacterium]|nr:hypothetical protein [Gemmatimonadota bacterium]
MKKLLSILFLLVSTATLHAGVEVWARSYLEPMTRVEIPPPGAVRSISIRVTPGEYEPAAFAVRSDSRTTVSVALSGLEGLDWLPASWCELHLVAGLTDSTALNRLYELGGPVELQPGKTQFFWLTVRPPENTRPGIYHGRVFLKSVHVMHQIEITCRVLPFRLEDSSVFGGTFMAETNLPEDWYKDMKEHGLDAIQSFWGYDARVINREGKLVMDLSRLDKYMEDVIASGMKGPVVLSLGNDYHLHYERRIAEAFGIEIDTLAPVDRKAVTGPAVSPRLDSLFIAGLRQIRDHWKAKGYSQELVILIYDEPTERLLERCKNRFDLLKTVMPDTRVYGVVMNRRAWAESMLDQMDIIVCNGDFEACRELADRYGKGFWIYSGIRGVHCARYDKGCLAWRHRAEAVWFWMYNYFDYNPNGCAVLPHPEDPDRLVRATFWEAIREGMDDLRYLATAEHLIEQAPAKKGAAVHRKLESLKESIDPSSRGLKPPEEVKTRAAALKYYNEPERVRAEVIDIILDLLGLMAL